MFEKSYKARSVVQNAAMIAGEIILEGRSKGWSGSSEDKSAIQKLLEKMNIEYVDDMHGTWELKH